MVKRRSLWRLSALGACAVIAVAVLGTASAPAAAAVCTTLCMSPIPMAPTGSLASGQTASVTISDFNGAADCINCTVALRIAPGSTGGGSATATDATFVDQPLTTSYQNFKTDANATISITYTAATPRSASGADLIDAIKGASTCTTCLVVSDSYTYSTSVGNLVWTPTPIASTGTLGASQSAPVTLKTNDGAGGALANATAWLSFTHTANGGSASVGATPLSATPTAFKSDGGGNLTVTYHAAALLPASGTDSITAQNAASSPTVTVSDSYTYSTTVSGYAFSPTPIAATATLAANQSVTVTVTTQTTGGSPVGNASVTLAFTRTSGGGSAAVGSTALGSTRTAFVSDGAGHVLITYQAPAVLPGSGTDIITAQNDAATITVSDSYTYSTPVTSFALFPTPIAALGTLGANQSAAVMLTTSGSGGPIGFAPVWLSFTPTAGGGSAMVGTTALGSSPSAFTSDSAGHVAITYHTPAVLPYGGSDTITAQNAASGATVSASDTYTFATVPNTTFYFAEGYTGSGFSETLSLLMPNHSGTATIDYYLEGGVHSTTTAILTAGMVTIVDVNAAVGANHQVSARVTLPSPGVAERIIHFNLPGQWHGSTDQVGAVASSTEWDFAEGSTLTNGAGGPLIFSEYLTLQNPNSSAVTVSLNYFTDSGLTPVKTLSLPANSRTTVEVFHGDTSNVSNCVPNGTTASCGVGPGIGGVSVQVKSSTLPIIAERPFYVDNFSLGDGAISDGHDTFGANAAGLTWNFAEGTTLTGFKEYLTLQNAGSVAATVNLNYFTNSGGHPVKTLNVAAHSRVTVEVFHGDATTNQGNCTPNGAGANCGVGPNVGGVSVQVTSNQPIVAERPMYMVVNFGTGSVAGAHVVVGATGLGQLFGFAAASTLTGENDYLTIQNPGGTAAQVSITYYTNSGPVHKSFSVSANTRVTVEVFKGSMTDNLSCSPAASSCGVGAGVSPLGIVLESSQPILVEKPTYNSTTAAYGATDTLAYAAPTF
jgi:hypothetical protein